jgi:TolA-binding protein
VSTGPAAAPPPAAENGGQPGAEVQPQQEQNGGDPWETAFSSIPEATRQFAEEAFNPLREQFTPRLELADRLEPLGDYADDLLALHGMADDDGNALEDFLGFAAMASQVDPENPDSEANQAFAEWFYEIGEKMGLIDPEDGDEPDDGEDEGYGEEPEGEAGELRQQLQAMQATIERLEAQPRIQSEQQRINTEVDAAIKEHGLTDDESTRKAILRFARDYVEQPNMVELAVKDVLTLNGGAQRGLLNGAETETVTAGASPGNGSPDLSPDEIATGDPSQTRRNAKQAALSRLRAAG